MEGFTARTEEGKVTEVPGVGRDDAAKGSGDAAEDEQTGGVKMCKNLICDWREVESGFEGRVAGPARGGGDLIERVLIGKRNAGEELKIFGCESGGYDNGVERKIYVREIHIEVEECRWWVLFWVRHGSVDVR